MTFKMVQRSLISAAWPGKVRAEMVGPRMRLKRDMAVSANERR